MHRFSDLYWVAVKRKGGETALESLLSTPLTAGQLTKIPTSAWLGAMAKALFQAGFNWSLIEQKWPAFQTVFHGFDVARIAEYGDDDLDRLLADKGIVRNGAKISAVIQNAVFLKRIENETGNASRYFADWPIEEHNGLLELFAREGARLGGVTGQRICRMVGRDSYVLTPDVCKRLAEEGVIEKPPTSRTAMSAVQDAFNEWRAESGRPLTQISQVLAMSVSP